METLSALLAFCEGNQKGKKYGALVFTLLLAWTSCGKNSRGAGGLRSHDAHVSSCVAKPLPALVWLCNTDSWLSFIDKGFNYMHRFSVEELCKMRIYFFNFSKTIQHRKSWITNFSLLSVHLDLIFAEHYFEWCITILREWQWISLQTTHQLLYVPMADKHTVVRWWLGCLCNGSVTRYYLNQWWARLYSNGTPQEIDASFVLGFVWLWLFIDRFYPHPSRPIFTKKSRRLIGIGIHIINLRRSDDRHRFIMGIPIPTRRRLLMNKGNM